MLNDTYATIDISLDRQGIEKYIVISLSRNKAINLRPLVMLLCHKVRGCCWWGGPWGVHDIIMHISCASLNIYLRQLNNPNYFITGVSISGEIAV